MAVVSLHSFRTEPGRLADHLAMSAEAIEHLHRMGLQAMTLQCLSGGDIGAIATIVNYANNADYATAIQKINTDDAWGEFWMKAAGSGAATQVESTLLSDVDPNYAPSADRPLGVIMATQWRSNPGRMMDFMGHVMESMAHVERLGGAPRVMQSVIGAHPMTTMVSVSFADLDAYGAYGDAIAGDQAWQDFWAGVMSDPTADLIRSGLYVNMSAG